MRVLDLNCNRCGAPLEVPLKTRFVTCSFCNTRLQVQREGSAAFTEVLDEISDDLEEIRKNTEIMRLDQEWSLSQEQYKVQDKHGVSRIPSVSGSRLGAVGVVVFGGLWTLFALSMSAPGFFPLFGVFFVVFGVVASSRAANKARAYEAALAAYQRKRQQLMAE